MKKIILIVVAIVIVAAAGIFLKKKKEEVASLKSPLVYIHSVSVTKPKTQTINQTRDFLAQVQSSKSAFIASKFSANIKKIYVNESDRVKKGQLLITLDDRDIKANLASLKAQENALKGDLKNAKDILRRNENLYKIEAISKEALQNSQVMVENKISALKTVQEKIKQTYSLLSYLNIKAPFNGVIGSKLANEGSLAIPGKPILTLNSDDQKLIFSFVDTLQPIAIGQDVLLNTKIIGKVHRLYDDAKNNLLVAEVKPFKALPYANKSFQNIQVITSSATGCSVPLNALLHKTDGTYLMVYKDSKFQARKINVLLHDENNALIDQCPTDYVATGSEAKLSILPTYDKVMISGAKE